jgi:hypothetical protein
MAAAVDARTADTDLETPASAEDADGRGFAVRFFTLARAYAATGASCFLTLRDTLPATELVAPSVLNAKRMRLNEVTGTAATERLAMTRICTLGGSSAYMSFCTKSDWNTQITLSAAVMP